MTYLFGNAQHQGARQAQQDAFAFTNPFDDAFAAHAGFAALVADGMGGLVDGDLAARAALTAFAAAYHAKPAGEPVAGALWRALEQANAAVCALQRDLGTTLVAAVLHDASLHWISVGDSGLFLFRDAKLWQVNTPHVYARELDAMVQQGRLSAEAAGRDPQREALTSHLGMHPLPAVDRGVIELAPGDVVMAASDGLFKFLPVAEIEARLAGAGSLQQQCDALVEAVIAQGHPSQDNVTVVALAAREEVALPVALPAPSRRPLAVAAAALIVSLMAGSWLLWRCCASPPVPLPVARPTLLKPTPPEFADTDLPPDPEPDPRAQKELAP